eukprot:430716-Amorphochlora_amoeboformis.AAC.4
MSDSEGDGDGGDVVEKTQMEEEDEVQPTQAANEYSESEDDVKAKSEVESNDESDDDDQPVASTQRVKSEEKDEGKASDGQDDDDEEEDYEGAEDDDDVGEVKEGEDEDEGEEEEEEEEEEEKEDANERQRKRDRREFTEDAAEVSGEDSGDEEVDEEEHDSDREFISNPRKKHKKMRRRRHIEALTADDYQLIQENTGKRVQMSIDNDIEENDDDDSDTNKHSLRRLKKARRARNRDTSKIVAADAEGLEEKLFGDDEDDLPEKLDSGPEEGIAGEMGDANQRRDDFLEPTLDSEDEDDFVVGGYGHAGENMARLVEIFGEEAEDFLRNVNPEDDVRQAKGRLQRKDLVEPSAREINYMSQRDEEIRQEDIPERLQERILLRGTNRAVTHDMLFDEARWINRHAFQDKLETK